MQTGATALLGAAAVAALYGVVHLFDLRLPRSVSHEEPAAEPVWPAAPEPARIPAAVVAEPEPELAAVAVPPPVKPARKPAAKAAKGKAAKAAKPPAPAVELFDAPQPPLSPLFEPEPFLRLQQRSMFGRKAG